MCRPDHPIVMLQTGATAEDNQTLRHCEMLGRQISIHSQQSGKCSCCHPREYPTEPPRRLHAPHEHPLQPGNHPAEQAPQWTPSSGTRRVPSPTYSPQSQGHFQFELRVLNRSLSCFENILETEARRNVLGYTWFQRVIGPNAVFTIGTIGSHCCPVT